MTFTNERKGNKNIRKRKDNPLKSVPKGKIADVILHHGLHLPKGFKITYIEGDDAGIYIQLTSKENHAVCPYCGCESYSPHGYCTHCATDLPIKDRRLSVEIMQRRFYCRNKECSHHTFTSVPLNYIERRSRYTKDCMERIFTMTKDMSSSKSSGMLAGEGIMVSCKTCTKSIMVHPLNIDYDSVSTGGIDDFAMKKGHVYGSVLAAHSEEGKNHIVDLIRSRDAKDVTELTCRCDNLKIMTRDRAGCFIYGVRNTKKNIKQSADRFHLIKDLSDSIFPAISNEFKSYRKNACDCLDAERWNTNGLIGQIRDYAFGCGDWKMKKKFHEWQTVTQLSVSKGMSIVEIKEATGIKSQKIRKYLDSDIYSFLSEHQSFYLKRASRIAASINRRRSFDMSVIECDLGTHCHADRKEWLRRLLGYLERKADKRIGKTRAFKDVQNDVKELWAYIFGSIDNVKSRFVEDFCMHRYLADLRYYCSSFRRMLNGSLKISLGKWITAALSSDIYSIEKFAKGIMNDASAVYYAIKYRYNNGMMEGFVCKVKNVKRQMYGRARFELLRRKVIFSEYG